MPCSQMISMNWRPPRAIDASSEAAFPAAKARLRNSPRWNIGCGTRVSTIAKTTRSTTPEISPVSTLGLSQPMVWLP